MDEYPFLLFVKIKPNAAINKNIFQPLNHCFQIELIKRREADYLKLRREYEEAVMQNDAMVGQMKKKFQDQVNELVEQVGHLCGLLTDAFTFTVQVKISRF